MIKDILHKDIVTNYVDPGIIMVSLKVIWMEQLFM